MALSLTQENFHHEITQSTKPVVIDVYASWCGPCQQMAPVFEALSQELGSKYKFASLNVDEARELSILYGITSVPTFLFIKDNEVVGRETGYMNKDTLKAKIETYLD